MIRPDASDRRGPLPSVVLCQNHDYHNRFIVKTIKQLCGEMRCRPGDIAVLARKTDRVTDVRFVLGRAGVPVVHFRDSAFDIFENNTKVITINSAKGLEFPIVFLIDLHEGELPRKITADDEDELAAALIDGMTDAGAPWGLTSTAVSYSPGAWSLLHTVSQTSRLSPDGMARLPSSSGSASLIFAPSKSVTHIACRRTTGIVGSFKDTVTSRSRSDRLVTTKLHDSYSFCPMARKSPWHSVASAGGD